jgi:hypothetical protein
MERPSTQSLFAQCRRYLHWGDVHRLLGERYPSLIAPADSFADPAISPRLQPWPRSRSLQVAISPCCCRDLPDVILRILPRLPAPLPRRSRWVRLPGSSPASSALPSHKMGWLPASFREHDFPRVPFRGCSYFVMFRPPSLLDRDRARSRQP